MFLLENNIKEWPTVFDISRLDTSDFKHMLSPGLKPLAGHVAHES